MSNIVELAGCVDCVMYLANGALPEADSGSDWKPEAIAANWPGYNVVVAGDETSEEHFSWSPCGVCGAPLGGSRYPCAAWKCEEVK